MQVYIPHTLVLLLSHTTDQGACDRQWQPHMAHNASTSYKPCCCCAGGYIVCRMCVVFVYTRCIIRVHHPHTGHLNALSPYTTCTHHLHSTIPHTTSRHTTFTYSTCTHHLHTHHWRTHATGAHTANSPLLHTTFTHIPHLPIPPTSPPHPPHSFCLMQVLSW